jgi:hypothetical protein
MANTTVDVLIVDMLTWLRERQRSYDDVMDSWRTSCPKLPVWEEANDRGFVTREQVDGGTVVRISAAGRAFLDRHFAESE